MEFNAPPPNLLDLLAPFEHNDSGTVSMVRSPNSPEMSPPAQNAVAQRSAQQTPAEQISSITLEGDQSSVINMVDHPGAPPQTTTSAPLEENTSIIDSTPLPTENINNTPSEFTSVIPDLKAELAALEARQMQLAREKQRLLRIYDIEQEERELRRKRIQSLHQLSPGDANSTLQSSFVGLDDDLLHDDLVRAHTSGNLFFQNNNHAAQVQSPRTPGPVGLFGAVAKLPPPARLPEGFKYDPAYRQFPTIVHAPDDKGLVEIRCKWCGANYAKSPRTHKPGNFFNGAAGLFQHVRVCHAQEIFKGVLPRLNGDFVDTCTHRRLSKQDVYDMIARKKNSYVIDEVPAISKAEEGSSVKRSRNKKNGKSEAVVISDGEDEDYEDVQSSSKAKKGKAQKASSPKRKAKPKPKIKSRSKRHSQTSEEVEEEEGDNDEIDVDEDEAPPSRRNVSGKKRKAAAMEEQEEEEDEEVEEQIDEGDQNRDEDENIAIAVKQENVDTLDPATSLLNPLKTKINKQALKRLSNLLKKKSKQPQPLSFKAPEGLVHIGDSAMGKNVSENVDEGDDLEEGQIEE